MRLTFTTQGEAQSVCDRIYTDMTAAGALEPDTVRWAVPTQDRDANGNLLGPDWYVAVDERCRAYLTAAEIAQIPEFQVVPTF